MNEILSINELGLTQIYLNQRKVNDVTEWLNDKTITQTAVTVIYHQNKPYLIDGHTRTFVAFSKGISRISAEIYECNSQTKEMQLYRTCIQWCEEGRVRHINDLKARIIHEEAFNEKWIKRCTNWMKVLERENNQPF